MFNIELNLQPFVFTGHINEFLLLLKSKAMSVPDNHASLDELYGLLPPTHVSWHSENSSLIIRNEWDNQRMTIRYAQNEFQCVQFKQFTQQVSAESDHRLIYQESLYRLELLHMAFNNHLLRITGIRNYFHEHLTQYPEHKSLTMELMIVLMSLTLKPEEEFDQDLFFRRAEKLLEDIIRRRAGYCVNEPLRELVGLAALRGRSGVKALYAQTIYMIWGYLANAKHLSGQKPDSAQSYSFAEKYYPNGKVVIGNIFSVPPEFISGFKQKFRYDQYCEIYPDFKTAQRCRAITLEILNSKQDDNHGTA